MRFATGARTQPGRLPGGEQRRNDDHLLIDAELGLILVLDGGGNWFGPDERAKRGAEVIQQVVRDEPATTSPQTLIERAFQIAGETLKTEVDEHGDCGTANVVLLLLRDGFAHISWLGDPMAHRVSGESITALTRPHTLHNEMLRLGSLTQEILERDGEKLSRVLCFYLGQRPDPLEVVSFTPTSGDRLILTTDGVHDVLSPSELLAACQMHPEPQACADHLVALALERGSRDNCTCVVITFE